MGITGDDRHVDRTLQRLKLEDLAKFASSDSDSVSPFPGYEAEGLLQTILPLNNLRPKVRKAHRDRRQIIQGYIDRAVEQRKYEGPPAQAKTALDILITHELANAEKAGRAPGFRSPIFNDALYGYCFGGQDTTHSSMSFLVKHFGMYQDAQRTLRANLQEAHETAHSERRNPTGDEILKTPIPYLDAFIEEVLRLNTTAAGVIKETVQDLVLLGHHIPKGTQVIVPLWDWTGSKYPANEFHPERWLRKDADTGRIIYDPKSGPHMTFSAGPRECWGSAR
ncbi:hypothetical protein DL770_002888 [Monosporascus sp. CRB-9-2]|nr:hypothetical protein DL770_002888 [Monosporascus sp. CRB-9-2]